MPQPRTDLIATVVMRVLDEYPPSLGQVEETATSRYEHHGKRIWVVPSNPRAAAVDIVIIEELCAVDVVIGETAVVYLARLGGC